MQIQMTLYQLKKNIAECLFLPSAHELHAMIQNVYYYWLYWHFYDIIKPILRYVLTDTAGVLEK